MSLKQQLIIEPTSSPSWPKNTQKRNLVNVQSFGLISDQNGQTLLPFSHQNFSETISFKATNVYITHIREPPPAVISQVTSFAISSDDIILSSLHTFSTNLFKRFLVSLCEMAIKDNLLRESKNNSTTWTRTGLSENAHFFRSSGNLSF